MSLLIVGEKCINCLHCIPDCPNDAITEDENGEICVIRTDWCTECLGFHEESQCQAVCPIDDCIIIDAGNPEPGPGNPEKEQTIPIPPAA